MYRSNQFMSLVLEGGGGLHHTPTARVGTQFPLLFPHLYQCICIMYCLDVVYAILHHQRTYLALNTVDVYQQQIQASQITCSPI